MQSPAAVCKIGDSQFSLVVKSGLTIKLAVKVKKKKKKCWFLGYERERRALTAINFQMNPH